MTSMNSQRSQRPAFRILVATDNHIGFKEDHHIRGEDSYDAFEEVLQIAKRNKVDFLLLGGDLFHEVTPSQNCLYRTIRLLQKFVFGSGDLSYETKTLTGTFPANYLNENLNIDLPIFIIHGNHDHPLNAGENISTLDLLHASKLVNYFGKFKNLDELIVEPILFEKQNVKVALYGIGHIKDTRLHYLFEKKKVQFVPPPAEDYMSILIIHQNRFKGIRPGAPYKNCIHPTMLPNFLDLIIWGNEHESTDALVEDPVQNFYIYQPGSSVPTSLNQAEALQKHVGLFEVSEKKNFRFVPIALRNQRPLYVKNIELEQLVDQKKPNIFRMEDEGRDKDKPIEKIIEEKIEAEFNKLMEENETNIATQKRLKNPPLVRIKVEYSGFDIIRIKQVELKFMGKVANEGDVLKFWRKQTTKKQTDFKKNKKLGQEFEEALKQKISLETLTSESNDVIKGLLEDLMQNANKKPKILPIGLFTQTSNQRFSFQAVSDHIGDTLKYAKKQLLADKLIESQNLSRKLLQKENEYLKSQASTKDGMIEEIQTQIKEYESHMNEIPKFLMGKLAEFTQRRDFDMDTERIKKEEEKEEEEPEESGGRGRKGTTKGRKKGGKKGVKEEDKEEEEDEDNMINSMGKMNLEKENKWDMYEKNSEDEDKEWFKDDFGRGIGDEDTGSGRQKGRKKEVEKPKGRGRGRSKVNKTPDDSENEEEMSYESPKRKPGRKRAGVSTKEMEELESSQLKKGKPATPNTSSTQKRASKPTNKFFL